MSNDRFEAEQPTFNGIDQPRRGLLKYVRSLASHVVPASGAPIEGGSVQPGKRSSFIRKIITVGTVNLIVIFLLFICIEVSGRTWYSLTTQNGGFFREPLFVSPWFTTRDRPAPDFVEIDGELHGLFKHRETPIRATKSPGEIRIVVMGGSTTKNQTAWKEAGIDYASELQTHLRKHYKNTNIHVLNAGSEAYSSAHTFVNFSLRLSAFRPDLIIVMHATNDRSVAYFGQHTMPDYTNKYMHPTYIAPEAQSLRSIYGFLIQSRILSRLGIAEIFAQREIDYSASIDDALTYYRNNLRNLLSVARASGVQVVLLSQPFLRSELDAKQIGDQEAFNNVALDMVRETSFYGVDMASEFGNDPVNFVDSVHYSASGVRWFSKILAPKIIAVLGNSFPELQNVNR